MGAELAEEHARDLKTPRADRLGRRLAGDHDHTYRKLFGDKWAKAYETEIRSPQRGARPDEEIK
jgi:predicted component of type VI protein secretion system